jgi:hypothetical protein
MRPRFIRFGLAVTLLAVVPIEHASSQIAIGPGTPRQQPNPAPSQRRSAFAINPLGIPLEIVSVEFEGALHDAFTLAGNFSYFSPDDFTRSSFEVKGRLYPNEQAPRAFSVGLGLGAVNTRENVSVVGVTERHDKTHPSLGVYVDYNWLLGKSSRFFVGTGVGAKRILGDDDEFDEAPFVYGTARFLIGVAF